MQKIYINGIKLSASDSFIENVNLTNINNNGEGDDADKVGIYLNDNIIEVDNVNIINSNSWN